MPVHKHEAQGRKEVAEHVLTAALTALATALAEWAVESLRDRAEARKKQQRTDAGTETKTNG